MIKFLLGIVLFTVGVGMALYYAGVLVDLHNAKNMVLGGLISLGLGVILSAWGYVDASSDKASRSR